MIIDKAVPKLKGKYAAICQNFQEDIYLALKKNQELFRNYRKINFIKSTSKFQFIPDVLIKGYTQFNQEFGFDGEIIPDIKVYTLQSIRLNQEKVILIIDYSMSSFTG